MFTLDSNIVIFGSKPINTGCYSLTLDFWGINNMAVGVKLHITYVGLNNISISFIFQ